MCLADATGEWDALIRTINLRQPRKLVAWAQARHGRYLALAGDGEAAKQEYLQAIERATEANLYSEASDWLYALRTVRFWHYTPSASSDDLHARAQALWPLAGPKTLPGSPYTKELALEAMLDETSPHEAIQRVRRWLWQVTIQASLADEMAAARALGRLLQRQEDYLPAIEAFVRAGEEKLAKAASSAAPDQALQIQAVRRSLPQAHAVAMSAVAQAADLLPDTEAHAWATLALEDCKEAGSADLRRSPNIYVSALELLAQTADLLEPALQDKLITFIDPLIDRPGDLYRPTDKPVARIIIRLIGHPSAPELLARGLAAGQWMAAELAAAQLNSPLPERFEPSLSRLAPTNRWAAMMLVELGLDAAAAIPLARQEVEQLLADRARTPGVMIRYSDDPKTAILASILDEPDREHFAHTMLNRALDQNDLNGNRFNSLAALHNIASHLEQPTKRILLPEVMALARGQYADSASFELGAQQRLSSLALRCVIQLDPPDDLWPEIELLGMTELIAASDSGQWHAAAALRAVPVNHSSVDLRLCAAHREPALRALAGRRWLQTGEHTLPTYIEALAHDPDHRVRRYLAYQIASADQQDQASIALLADVLRNDVRRSIRSIMIRRAAQSLRREER